MPMINIFMSVVAKMVVKTIFHVSTRAIQRREHSTHTQLFDQIGNTSRIFVAKILNHSLSHLLVMRKERRDKTFGTTYV